MDGHSHILIRASLHLSAGVLVESEQVKACLCECKWMVWYERDSAYILRKCKSICTSVCGTLLLSFPMSGFSC